MSGGMTRLNETKIGNPSQCQDRNEHGELDNIRRLIGEDLSIVRCIGKAPNGSIYSKKVTTTDLAIVAHWMKQGYNLGVTTTTGSRLHIDVDPRWGGDMEQLTNKYKLRRTWACWSGGEPVELNGKLQRGAHLFYRAPTGVQFCSDATSLGNHISVLGHGLQGIIPPSIHPESGNSYTWMKGCSPCECELAEASPKIVARLLRKPDCTPPPDDTPIDEIELPFIEMALAAYPNDDLHYDEWFKVVAALYWAEAHAATLEIKTRLRDMSNQWSRDSKKFDETTQKATRKGLDESQRKEKLATITTLYQLAGIPLSIDLPMMSDEDRELFEMLLFRGHVGTAKELLRALCNPALYARVR